MSSETLNPCPFCGGDSETMLLFSSEKYPDKTQWDGRCMSAGCILEFGTSRIMHSEKEVIEFWNKQPFLARLESEKGRLEKENEKLREGMMKAALNDMAESLDKERKEIEDDRRRTGAYIEEQRRKRGSPL